MNLIGDKHHSKQLSAGYWYHFETGTATDTRLDMTDLDPASKHPRYTAKICDFGLAVSLLDPHFGWRPVHSGGLPPLGPGAPPH